MSPWTAIISCDPIHFIQFIKDCMQPVTKLFIQFYRNGDLVWPTLIIGYCMWYLMDIALLVCKMLALYWLYLSIGKSSIIKNWCLYLPMVACTKDIINNGMNEIEVVICCESHVILLVITHWHSTLWLCNVPLIKVLLAWIHVYIFHMKSNIFSSRFSTKRSFH